MAQDNDKTLDPKDWTEIQSLGHKILDDMIDYLQTVRERKVWQAIPEHVKAIFESSIPKFPVDEGIIYQEVKEFILPYPQGNIHPRFWGWVNGTGTPFGILAEMIMSTMNVNSGGREHVSNYVERQVIEWMKDLFGFPQQSSGILTAGCSVSNFIGIIVARNNALGYDVRKIGIQGHKKPLRLYGSNQMHSSIQKALELAGIGSDAINYVPTNDDFSIDTKLLREAIQHDIELGCTPICVVGNIGSVNTGSVDNISELRKICDEFNIWLHLDGAFGAFLRLSDKSELVEEIGSADSLAFDFHKWMHVQYDVGCVLVRDENIHRSSFSLRPSYLASIGSGLAGGGVWFSEYGMQLSRAFRALKVWMLLRANGINRYAEMINKNLRQAEYFASLVEKQENCELLAPVISNVVCFRHNPGVDDENELEDLNKKILAAMYDNGRVVTSYTSLRGKYCLRIAITNHRSTMKDFDILAAELQNIIKHIDK
ncbi:MAG: aminotransferase class I/II-fold pyridoxal phosphate-dependent enzyme [Candidatus Heimdallarchaeota archaeon]|nr:aminotransferase class I/II-fold pyridoxal phosphate-dependent enzyme [Candidatus Heimdallarchaeota archaeon]